MNIMQNILTRLARSTRRGFTLLESLLVLFVVSFLAVQLAGSVQSTFQAVEETLFFWEFEHLFRDSQKLAAASQQTVVLELREEELSNGYHRLEVPTSIHLVEEKSLVFNQEGGNSSLAKLVFQTEQKTVRYQLYLGSGRYKKTEE